MKIHSYAHGALDVKRLYLNGVKISGDCPRCKKPIEIDFGKMDYLSFPRINESFIYCIYCPDCGAEWSINLQLTVSLSIVESKKE